MKKYDVIVIGSGSGREIVELALNNGLSVAWVDKGPLGGTCLNVGCIPSKMLVYPADRIMEIQEAEKLGVKAEIKNIDPRGSKCDDIRRKIRIYWSRHAYTSCLTRIDSSYTWKS